MIPFQAMYSYLQRKEEVKKKQRQNVARLIWICKAAVPYTLQALKMYCK